MRGVRRPSRLGAVVLSLVAGAAAPATGELLPVQAFTTQNGLPHNRVKKIRQDRLGFVWIATTEGLCRFDGRVVTTYGVEAGLPVPSVNDLVETEGGFWVATNGGGVAFFDTVTASPRPFLPFPVGEDAAARVNVLLLDGAGTLWAGTDGGLFRLRGASPGGGTFVRVPLGLAGRLDAAVPVWALLSEEKGVLAATHFGLVRVEEGKPPRHVSLSGRPDDYVVTLARAEDGAVLAGHETEGLLFLDPASLAPVRRLTAAEGLSPGAVNAVLSADGRLLVGTSTGFCTLAPEGLACFTGAHGLTDDLVRAIEIDRDGGTWLGTEGGGAMRLPESGAVIYGEGDGLGRYVSSVFRMRDGSVCAVSSGWRLSRFDGKRVVTVEPLLPEGLSASRWRFYHGVLQDRDGGFWIVAGDVIVRYGPVRDLSALATTPPRAVYSGADGLPSDRLSRIFEDSRGDVWVGSFTPAKDPLTRWVRSSGRFERFGAAHGLPGFGSPDAFAEDLSGSVWVAYRGGGLARYRNGVFQLLSGKHGLPETEVRQLLADSSGRLWLSASGFGLLRVDHPGADEPRAVPLAGISDFYLGGLAEDADGGIVVSTRHGILRVDPATSIVSALGVTPSDATGTQRDRAGTLWMATARGLVRLPKRRARPPKPPVVRIERVAVSGVERSLPSLGVPSVALGELPSSARLSVSFFGLGRPGQQLRFDHWLEGFDDGWAEPHADPVVRYGNLAPGRHRLRIRAIGPGGLFSAPAEVTFTVLPPLVRRWWFLAGAASLLAGAGYGVKAVRDRRQHALDAVRARIASDLHDDLGASLSRISILAEVARRRARDGGSPDEVLEKVGAAARGVLESLADGIWAVDPRRDDLESLGGRLGQAASELLSPSGIAWRIVVPEGAAKVRLHPARRRQIYLLLKEAIVNAARHSGAGEVTIALSADPPGKPRRRLWDRRRPGLAFELRDDGRGFDPGRLPAGERLAGGRGLSNMRRRAAELGGALEIESAPGRGTAVRFRLPPQGGA